MRVLLVSSVAPLPTSGGQLLLYRHLVNQAGLDLGLVLETRWPGVEPALVARPGRFFQRLRATRFTQQAQRWQERLGWMFAAGPVLAFAREFRPDIVLTVAHGFLAPVAMQAARRQRCPLAAIFHDWWPSLAPPGTTRREERFFRALYATSDAAFCVSDPLQAELGEHRNAVVLLPIPGESAEREPPSDRSCVNHRFNLVYTGSLNAVYREGLEQLCALLQNHPRIQLELWGDASDWPGSRLEALRASAIYRGVTHGNDPSYLASLAGAHALLTHLSFAPAHARRVRTSFPSKLVDYTRWAKPLVVWAPNYSSAVEWLRPRDAALLIDAPEPAAVVSALESLANAPERQQQLGARAADLYRTDLAPANLQRIFREGLARALARST